jgi:hypothetical protein
MTRIYDLSGHDATVDISAGSPEQYPYVSSDDSVTFSLSDDTVTLDSGGYDYTLGANVSITGIGVPWTTNTGISSNWDNNTAIKITANGRLELSGEDADVVIRGESLTNMLKTIEQRLNILRPNEALEQEWEELKKLGDQYRTLEKYILEKQSTWDKLSKIHRD